MRSTSWRTVRPRSLGLGQLDVVDEGGVVATGAVQPLERDRVRPRGHRERGGREAGVASGRGLEGADDRAVDQDPEVLTSARLVGDADRLAERPGLIQDAEHVVGDVGAGDEEPGTVADVILPAYGEGDHQLRPAQVVVARPD